MLSPCMTCLVSRIFCIFLREDDKRCNKQHFFVNAISIYCTHACFRRAREDSFKAVLNFISHCIHVRFIKEEFVAFSMDFNLFHDCKECLLHLHFVSCIFAPYFGHSLTHSAFGRSVLLHSWFNIISLKNALQWVQSAFFSPSLPLTHSPKKLNFFIYKNKYFDRD